jgi:hypothetical protein
VRAHVLREKAKTLREREREIVCAHVCVSRNKDLLLLLLVAEDRNVRILEKDLSIPSKAEKKRERLCARMCEEQREREIVRAHVLRKNEREREREREREHLRRRWRFLGSERGGRIRVGIL